MFVFCNVIHFIIFCFRSKIMRHLYLIVLVLLRVELLHCPLQTGRLLPLTEGIRPLWSHTLLLCEEVSSPKIINIKQQLSTNNFSANNRHFIIKSSQTTQLYITKVFYLQFSCQGYIRKQFSSEGYRLHRLHQLPYYK